MLKSISSLLRHRTWKIVSLCRALNTFNQRTHTCGDLTKMDGEKVDLYGWVHSIRFKGKFFMLRDAYGLVQVVSGFPEIVHKVPSIDSVVRVTGIVQRRPESQVNKEMLSGAVEVIAEDIEVINSCHPSIPIYGKDVHEANEMVRYQYRYLDLRRPVMADRLRMRSRLLLAMRRCLCERHGFVDVETPTLFRRTPGGAREFVVPTHDHGRFYSLVQSPQQFKQLLMVAGIDRYMQIARCYRDESGRPDRQPEFTQLDLEMSFVDQNDVCGIVEDLFTDIWPILSEAVGPMVPSAPFPRLTFDEAMRTYGTDKPDLRFDLRLRHVSTSSVGMTGTSNSWCCIVLPQSVLRQTSTAAQGRIQNLLTEFQDVCESKAQVQLSQPLRDDISLPRDKNIRNAIGAKDDELLFIGQAEKMDDLCTLMGDLRLRIAKFLSTEGVPIYKPGFHFLWVDNFPLFTSDEKGNLLSSHHPFTAPVPEDAATLYTQPEMVRGQHYDLVCNGVEVGGGSIRIHEQGMQQYVIEHILKEDHQQLGHLIDALGHGCPPHGGIALGLDRLLALVNGVESIREVIAFPKSSEGRDPMSGAPSEIDFETKAYYGLK